MANQHLKCSICGADGELGCDHGAGAYVPASEYAAMAIERNPEKSNRAIAEETGVSEFTIRQARKEGAINIAPEKRQGRDGKMYPAKQKATRPVGKGQPGYRAGRGIDNATGEEVSRTERHKIEAVAESKAEIERLRELVAKYEMELGHAPTDLATLLIRRKLVAEREKAMREANKAARRTHEAIPDEKTKEEYERTIKALRSEVRNLKSKNKTLVANRDGFLTAVKVLTKTQYKTILVALHPDNTNEPILKARLEKAFKVFTEIVPEPVE